MNNRPRLLLIDHYDSFTYNLLALIQMQGATVDLVRNNEYRRANSYDGLVFSPGPSHPKNAGSSLDYFDAYAGKLPIFGVCLGMQIMAYKLGQGESSYAVRQAASIQHGKTDQLCLLGESQLFSGLPEGLTVVRYHSLACDLPSEYVSARAQSDQEVMSLEIPALRLYGVQFHPESLLSEYGDCMLANFLAQL